MRAAREEVQRGEREAIERSRAAARAWRGSVLSRRAGLQGGIRMAYERRVQLLLIGVTPRGYTPAALARPRRCSRSRCQQRPYWHYWYTVGGGGASAWHRSQPDVLSSPKIRRLTACVNTVVLARAVSTTPPSMVIVTPVLGGPEVVHNPALAVQGKKRQGSPCSLGVADLTCDN